MNTNFDDPLWEAFFKGHPLHSFCSSHSFPPYFQEAELLVHRILQHVEHDIIIPYSPDLIEDYLIQHGILIEDKIINSPMPECNPSFMSACEPEKRLIKLYAKAIIEQAKRISINAPEMRALLLAHEWFHIIFFEWGTPLELDKYSESEIIIIEEVAARIFAVRLLGSAFHPTILDGKSPSVR